ncbi:MAG: hypothetical protein OEV59_10205, partial [Deltaproteobacteria bacterium]|nr:hypothetical protein [Deltaproteobacteria bacterium]
DDRLRLGKEANLKRRDYSVDIASNCSDVSSRSACWEAIFTYSRAGRDECSVMLTFVITTL